MTITYIENLRGDTVNLGRLYRLATYKSTYIFNV